MKKNKIIKLISLIAIISLISCSTKFVDEDITNKNDCKADKNYWYKNKCWLDFEDKGVLKSEIDNLVKKQMKIINRTKIKINNKQYPLLSFFPLEEDDKVIFLAVYKINGLYKTILIPVEEDIAENKNIKATAILFDANVMNEGLHNLKPSQTGVVDINIIDIEKLNVNFSGTLTSLTKTPATKVNFSFTPNEAITGAGTSILEIKGKEAYLSGDLGTITYAQIKGLIKNHKEVKTLVLTKISGSVNDEVNMHTGRLVRESGLNTKVLATSDIASGGVDLFTAGNVRIVEKGAKIGVHSWCCVNEKGASKIPKDHPAHKYQLEYFKMTLGLKGESFYFYTLNASDFEDVHYMSDNEIKNWEIATQFIEK